MEQIDAEFGHKFSDRQELANDGFLKLSSMGQRDNRSFAGFLLLDNIVKFCEKKKYVVRN